MYLGLASSAFTHYVILLVLELSFKSMIPLSYALDERIERINFDQPGNTHRHAAFGLAWDGVTRKSTHCCDLC